MKKILAAVTASAVALSSCSMPWSKETPTDLPPPIAPVQMWAVTDSAAPAASSGVSVADGNAPTVGTGVVDPNPPTGTAVPPPELTAPQGAWSGSVPQASTGTVDDAEVKAAVDEIDKLFDGIAWETGSGKK